MKTFLVSINNLNDISKYKEVGVTTFLFPLSGYAIGYPNTFELEEIPEDINSYILINKLLNCEDVDNIKKILCDMPGYIKGIVYEDVAIYSLVQELGKDIELIWFQNHFGTNSEIINYWLEKGVDSAFIANELTRGDIEFILGKSTKPLVIQVFGYNQVMYSRRTLLSNYTKHFNLTESKCEVISEKASGSKFIIYEDESSTVLWNYNIYNALSLLDLSNIKYYFINTLFIDTATILQILHNIDNPDFDFNNLNLQMDEGFLDKKTIYKLNEQPK